MLASRGVDPTLNDDIVQEVAVRALDKRVPFTDPDDLYRWAATAARRLHIDHLRSDGRTTGDDSLLLVADGTDVAHTAERRVVFGEVLRAIAVMRPGERDAILDSLEDGEARTSQALVRRHRARATLRKAVGSVLVWVTVGRLRLRELSPAVRTATAAVALAPVLAVSGGGHFADLPDRPLHRARPPAAQASADARDGVPVRTGVRAPAVPAATDRHASRGTRPAAEEAPPRRPVDRHQVGPAEIETDPNPKQKPIWCTVLLGSDPVCVERPVN